jgi:hypothetical protein
VLTRPLKPVNGEPVYVTPIDDLREHVSRDDCPCNPRREHRPGSVPVYVHNSWDGRELVEKHGLQ